MTGMFLRWSGRDLRRHWVAVVAIGLVLGIGTGVFAGLGSTATWRRQSNDESFAATGIHDLRVALSPGTFTGEGSLRDLLDGIPSAGAVTAAAERLVVDT
ncbi:MAG: ABC transporter permease, partial [Actinobacteria bacterium]|nr:ABC transporter permease [Actinomycetota bacterium]NIS35837.1 ABC transporter permease [Actinomycetota bacterium]NIT98371.1 ABC transporter permease [Actinomycetota bacterium]NIU21988.1 ABC transporter permease [Actinomycetota bacterium]NIU70464.1 ABC transporter permease [Actinomycetota bacterium]